MDPDLQEAFNEVQNSVYRTALKLRAVQSLCQSFFEFYAVPDGKKALITRSALRSLLTDLNQIPAIVGESCTLSCVEIATHSCFQGVLNSAIVEEKFLSWQRSEPALLLWLPTCYRLSASETVSHQVRCRVCKNFPITGLRYRCLKCLNFDLCQVCFFTGCVRKPHKRSHPVVEHCVQMSAKASAKHFLRTVRNNLFQDCCRRKEAQRRRALEIIEERQFPTHEKIVPLAELSTSPFPENLSLTVDRPALESPTFVSENRTVTHKSKNNSETPEQDKTKIQAIASFEADMLKMYDSIKSIQNESRYMKKQFNKWKDEVQFLHSCQEDKSCKIETTLQSLRASHENLRMELQQIKQDIKTMLQSTTHPSFSLCQNMIPRNQHVLLEGRMQGGLNFAQIKPISRTCADWKALNHPNSENRMQLLETPEVPATMNFIFSEDPVKSVTPQSDGLFIGQCKKAKENQTYLPELMENSCSGIVGNTALTPSAIQIPPDEKEVSEEVELQQLVMKLKDALSLQAQPAQQSALKQDFFSAAERVCRSFSDLINQITLPTWK